MPTVLVVDDEVDIRDMLDAALSWEGYGVATAVGAAAIGAAADRRPGVILLDINMPGMDGPTVLGHLQADPATRDIPVVLMSAARRLREHAGRPGVTATLAKPFDLEAALAVVARLAGPPG